VPETRRAWHAGQSFWKGDEDINSRSIGIEIGNCGVDEPYCEEQISQLIALCQSIITRHQIPQWHVLAHSDVAMSRKQDPGAHFPWAQLASENIGHWVEPEPILSGMYFCKGESGQPVEALQSMLALYGYDVDVTGSFDQKCELAVMAFQRHFRPEKVDGIADMSTIKTLHRLLGALPKLD